MPANLPHYVAMPRLKPKAKFEPLELKAEPGWCVSVTLPHGERIQVGRFQTEAKARDWIADKAADWLKNYRGGRYA
jgi:hypothetical protein